MLNKIINLLRPLQGRVYVCEPYDGPGLRLKVRAWSAHSARIKAHSAMGIESLLDISVKVYEK